MMLLLHNFRCSPRLRREYVAATVNVRRQSSTRQRCFSALGNSDDDDAVQKYAIEKTTWVERATWMPARLKPYVQLARLNRPDGTYMLLWPGYWSIALAAPVGTWPDARLLALFGLGSIVMRSAGCTINDLWDADFDKQVERTNQRPLAAGTLSTKQAVGFLAFQLSIGLGVLVQLNSYSVVLGASSLGLVVAYPLMKRITYWPQAFLGLTFNWGALLGWAAVHGSCAWPVVLPLYGAGVCWTIVYDTLYAHQDKLDDRAIGVRSTALLFGDRLTVPVLSVFSLGTVGLLALAGDAAGLSSSWPWYLGLGITSAHLGYQVFTARLDDPVNLQKRFSSNKWLGGLVFSSIVAANLVT